MIARFIRDGRRINYLVNYRDKPMEVPLGSMNGSPLAVQVYHPLDGTIIKQQVPATVTIGPQSSLLLVESETQP